MKVLVVDDDPVAGEMTAAILEDAGHSVVLAENGMDAVDKLDTGGDFQLVVSDMNMPLVSGIDLFRTMRDQGVNIPFILLTGDNAAKFTQEEPRLDGCVMKDFNIEVSLPEAVADLRARRGA